MTRRANVAKVQIARKELGMDDVAYRLMLERLTGQTSSADCSDAQLGLVLDEMKAKGWTPKFVAGGRIGRRTRPVADHPSAKKARALWLSLWNLGEVRDPSEPALEAFARRQLGVEQLQWADQAQCYKLIEALKAMAERAGWSQDTSGLPRGTDLVKVLKVGLLRLQAKRMGMKLAIDRQPGAIFQADHSALDQAIRSLGDQIRAAATDAAG